MSSGNRSIGHLSIEGLNAIEASRLLEKKRIQLRVLQLETQLVEQEARRLRGSTASSASRHTSEHVQPSNEPTSSSKHSLHATPPPRSQPCSAGTSAVSSRTGSLLSLVQADESPAATLSPRSPSVRRSSRISRRTTSSSGQHQGRLPRSLIRQLAEKASQEAQRQLEALHLRGSVQQKSLCARTEAIKSQFESIHEALEELNKLKQRSEKKQGVVTFEAVTRWELGKWVASTEREAQRLRLQLGAAKNHEKRLAHRSSEADMQLLMAHTQRRHEELETLQKALQKQRASSARKVPDLSEKESEMDRLRREVSSWRTKTQVRCGMVFALWKRNQQLAREALALEEKQQDRGGTSLQMVTEYACLRGREHSLRAELTGWERRQRLLSAQLQGVVRRHQRHKNSHQTPAPQSSPAGSGSRAEVSCEHREEEDEPLSEPLASSAASTQRSSATLSVGEEI